MTDMTIVHLSDLHFGSPRSSLTPNKALALVARAIEGQLTGRLVLVISGDITTAGDVEAYDEARGAIADSILEAAQFDSVLVCPGNHDIVRGSSPFGPFNKFAYNVTHSAAQAWNATNSVVSVPFDAYEFLLINTSHHLDPRFGEVPMGDFERAAQRNPSSHKIAVLHHSPTASRYGGQGLANAYEFLASASRLSLAGLLHGHIHSEQALLVGSRPTFIAGVGSLSFKPPSNMNNQFSVYRLEAGRMTRHTVYRYFDDVQGFVAHDVESP